MLLALDPGTLSPGLALFESGVLLHAERVIIPASYAEREDGERWFLVSCIVAERATRLARGLRDEADATMHIIFERPQWYAKTKSKGDPNQLAGVAAVASTVVGIVGQSYGLRVFSPTPAQWIGQLPKTCPYCKANKKKCPECKGSAWNTPRGRRICSRLSPAERALVPDQNDAIDAVGLGLFKLGRLTPRSTLSNGRDGR